ncbi:MAG: hypothetical protein KGY99_09885 [Phycisphaerae bacterium]|nr:hypothetical protein [Phycisphaerae bacterium]
MAALRRETSLNGWWDFLPDLTDAGRRYREPEAIPDGGWLPGRILVPGSWTRGGSVGDEETAARRPWQRWRIFDSYGYPGEWDAMNTAWYRRTFTVEALPDGRRWFLHFGGVLRYAWYFVNGRLVGRSTDGILPSEHDVTDALVAGENTLVVYVTDYERNDAGKTFVPVGCDQMTRQKGIWQDVRLIQRPEVYVSDVTIRTSTRRDELTVLAEITNASPQRRTVRPELSVRDAAGLPALELVGEPVAVDASATETVELSRRWAGYRPWSPQSPVLYWLTTRLTDGATLVDAREDRFGFREVWVEGHRIMLNGKPVHLAGEWCHKHSLDSFRPEYVRQWYRMLKDLHMNYIRTHTFPHPPVVLDLADEMGILVSVESGWQFGKEHAVDDERLWDGAARHARNIIARDKNHPSVILWSVGNECRWNHDREAIVRNMPRLRAVYERLDPTRIAYHDGDSSLWDERAQKLISRHYGLECSGAHGWDRSRPLHVGELGKWHFGQPIDNLIWGDDTIFGSFRECHRAVAREAADIIEQGRANEVACLFPWNLSGLDNYRPWPTERTFDWPDAAAPHVKPLRAAPYGCEFAWWAPDAPGYAPGVSFPYIQRAFRPVALVVRERLNCAFADRAIRQTVTVVNDSGGSVRATLRVRALSGDDEVLWEAAEFVSLDTGRTERHRWEIPPLDVAVATEVRIETTLGDTAQVHDRVERTVRIVPAAARKERWELPAVAAVGDGSMTALLADHGVAVERAESIAEADASATPLLVVEKDAIEPGSTQHRDLGRFVRAGGRAVVLEQHASPLPQLTIETKPAERAHVRGGREDVLAGVAADDLAFWGEEPYGLIDSDSWVVVSPYRKPAGVAARVLVDSGWGSFGGGGLQWTPLVEAPVGDGLVLACQLRLTDKAASHPVAMDLLRRLLRRAADYRPSAAAGVEATGRAGAILARLGFACGEAGSGEVLVAEAGDLDAEALGKQAERVAAGATGVVIGVDAAAAERLSQAYGATVETVNLGPVYHLVRTRPDAALDGISNQDTYWLDKAHYGPGENVNHKMTDALLRCDGGEATELLSSESESCWREFYTEDAKGEEYRMAAVTHYLWDGPRASAAGLLRLRHGQGRLVLCQIPLPDEPYAKAERFYLRLLENLGARSDASALSGETTQASDKRSDGFPPQVRYLADPSDAAWEEVLHRATIRERRIPNQGLRAAFDWTLAETPDGLLRIEADAERIVVFCELSPGRPRKAAPVEGGLPDPQQQTLLELTGGGLATLYVNGRAYQPAELGEEGKATVADIDLDAQWNTIVLDWTPPAQRPATLGLRWRDRHGRDEVEFDFSPCI